MDSLKPIVFIPPVVALMVVSGWIGTQRRSIATLENESALLKRNLIEQRTQGNGVEPESVKSAASDKSAKEKEPIQWKQVAALFAEMRTGNGSGDMRAMLRFQKRLLAMNREELITALDEISALDLPANDRFALENLLIGPLAQKDPELALTQFIDRINDESRVAAWPLSSALQQWAKKNPLEAAAWFDRQIAAGKFDSKSLDGKSQNRIQFEGVMIHVLLESDTDAAANRLSAMPADQRLEIVNSSFSQIRNDDQAAMAKLIRDQLPAKEQSGAIAQQASLLASGGDYSKVTDYLVRISATPGERTACVEQAAATAVERISYKKKVTRDDIDSMRDWVGSQSPESMDSTTGKALGKATQGAHKIDFKEASELAIQYQQAGGGDDVLSSFLESGAIWTHKEEARLLAEKISDVKRRTEILIRLK